MLSSSAVIVGLAVIILLALFIGIARMVRKAGPNQAIIVYGFGRAPPRHQNLAAPSSSRSSKPTASSRWSS